MILTDLAIKEVNFDCFFFPQLLWKKLRNKLIQLNLVDLVLREVDLEGVPQCHHLKLCELVLLRRKKMDFFVSNICSPAYLRFFSLSSPPFSLSSSHPGSLQACKEQQKK